MNDAEMAPLAELIANLKERDNARRGSKPESMQEVPKVDSPKETSAPSPKSASPPLAKTSPLPSPKDSAPLKAGPTNPKDVDIAVISASKSTTNSVTAATNPVPLKESTGGEFDAFHFLGLPFSLSPFPCSPLTVTSTFLLSGSNSTPQPTSCCIVQ